MEEKYKKSKTIQRLHTDLSNTVYEYEKLLKKYSKQEHKISRLNKKLKNNQIAYTDLQKQA